MSTCSDRRLWEQALEGEATAFGELFERHATSVYNYPFRRCGNWATAQDLTSLVFLELWRKRSDISLERDFALPLLFGVTSITEPKVAGESIRGQAEVAGCR